MHKLFWKIFIPVLLAMFALIAVSLLWAASSSARQVQDIHQTVPQLYQEAKDILLDKGEVGLSEWLKENTDALPGLDIYISRRGQRLDLLQRQLPPRKQFVEAIGNRIRGERRERFDRRFERRNRRPAPSFEGDRTDRFPHLNDQEGNAYRMVVSREPRNLSNLIRNQSMFWPILFSMFLISGIVSALIARMISQPIRRLRVGVQRIAQGNLKERVTSDFTSRKDEIGELAHDFDAMSSHISELLDTQQRMLRDVSHELRSPLARMQVALGLAEKRSNDAIKPELTRIETEVNTLNEMIGKVLSLVRLQNLTIDQSDLKWEQVDLIHILQSIVKAANYEAQEKNVTVELSGPASVKLNILPDLLHSALENIIRNAVQYTKAESSIEVNIKQKNESYLITIRDHGPGVPEEAFEKLFEPFYRVSHVREHNKGTGGIGLAIAKRAVELHNGHIWAENIEHGLGVFIVLPGK